MPDLDSQIRHAIESLIQQKLDGEASRRGWDLGADAKAAQESGTGAPSFADTADAFTTGQDPITQLTVTPFTFDLSALDGTDVLV